MSIHIRDFLYKNPGPFLPLSKAHQFYLCSQNHLLDRAFSNLQGQRKLPEAYHGADNPSISHLADVCLGPTLSESHSFWGNLKYSFHTGSHQLLVFFISGSNEKSKFHKSVSRGDQLTCEPRRPAHRALRRPLSKELNIYSNNSGNTENRICLENIMFT